jgi:chemotaxis protein CheD
MSQIHVGIGEYTVSGNEGDVIKTFALGSCVAVVLYDRERKIAGLIHIALPDSSINSGKAESRPGYFVDTGLPAILNEMKKQNASMDKILIRLVGGSNIMDEKHRFDIGKRNVLSIKKYLWKKQLGIISEDTGGSICRTVRVTVADGELLVSSGKRTWVL